MPSNIKFRVANHPHILVYQCLLIFVHPLLYSSGTVFSSIIKKEVKKYKVFDEDRVQYSARPLSLLMGKHIAAKKFLKSMGTVTQNKFLWGCCVYNFLQ